MNPSPIPPSRKVAFQPSAALSDAAASSDLAVGKVRGSGCHRKARGASYPRNSHHGLEAVHRHLVAVDRAAAAVAAGPSAAFAVVVYTAVAASSALVHALSFDFLAYGKH